MSITESVYQANDPRLPKLVFGGPKVDLVREILANPTEMQQVLKTLLLTDSSKTKAIISSVVTKLIKNPYRYRLASFSDCFHELSKCSEDTGDSRLISSYSKQIQNLSTSLYNPFLFPEKTEFGRFIKPLFFALQQIGPMESLTQAEQIANELTNFYRPSGNPLSTNIADIELTPADEVFLMGHPIGDTIRRPHLHYWLADRLKQLGTDYCIVDDASESSFDSLCSTVRKWGFSEFIMIDPPRGGLLRPNMRESSRFCGDDQGVIVSAEEAAVFRTMSDSPFGNNLQVVLHSLRLECMNRCSRISKAYENLQDVVIGLKQQGNSSAGIYLTDPGHLWNALFLNLRCLVRSEKLPDEIVQLIKDQTLLVVEDNRAYHPLYRPFLTAKVSFFGPRGIENSAKDDYPIFTDCESAYERLTNAISEESALPSVIVVDIELGRDKRDGLTFLEDIHKLLTDLGCRKKILLACATSSHIALYEERIAELIKKGVIDRGYNKVNFTALELATHIAEIKKRLFVESSG
jgi:hypothetical protein